jgi:predicted dehydrogenase
VSARIGLAGCGWWSTYAHLPALAAHPDAQIAALADPDAANLRAAAERFGVAATATFSRAEEMLDAVALDGVVIATPHALHHPLARAALERGLHVLVEKPLVLDPAHGRELVALARREGVELLVGYPYHYSEQVLAVRRALAAGRIGPLEHVTCLFASTVREFYRGRPEAYRDLMGFPLGAPGAGTYSEPGSGGQGYTQLTHAAALLLWLTGLKPQAVSAFTERFELEVDLADALAVRFEGGAVGALSSVGSVQPGQPELLRCELFGRDGHVLFDVNEGIASVHGPGERIERLPVPEPAARYPEGAPAANLVGVALGREGNGSPGEVGLATAELMAAMHRSAGERRAVALEELR